MTYNKKMLEKVDVMGFLHYVPCGYMLFDNAAVNGVDFKSTIFIKLEEKYIKKLGDLPIVRIKAGLVAINNVPIVNLQIEINKNEKLHFESFLNYMLENEVPIFKDFSIMDYINIVFVNERNEVSTVIRIRNTVKNFFKESRALLSSKCWSWSYEDFEMAKRKLMSSYSMLELWERLSAK